MRSTLPTVFVSPKKTTAVTQTPTQPVTPVKANRWELRTCGRRGHITYHPTEADLTARLHADTQLGQAWRCLRCGDFGLGAPTHPGRPTTRRWCCAAKRYVSRSSSGCWPWSGCSRRSCSVWPCGRCWRFGARRIPFRPPSTETSLLSATSASTSTSSP
jgi:hypothetical protein